MSNYIDIVACYFNSSDIIFQSDVLKPMQLGKGTTEIDLGFNGDDTGNNISAKHKYYGEDTALYWLWKNSKADIKGSMNGSELFNLISENKENESIAIEDIKCPEQFVLDLGLYSENISRIMENIDVIIPQKQKNGAWNIEEQYKACHIPEYLDYTIDIIKHDFPDIYPAAKRILAGNSGWFKNLLIMKSEIFDALCEFKFSVFEKLEKLIDVNRPEIASGWRHTASYAAFIGEIMTMFYVEYLHEREVKIAEFPVVNIAPRVTDIDDIELNAENIIAPAFGVDAVAILTVANNAYAPCCGVMLQSIIENARTDKNYDVIIASSDISDKNKKLLESMSSPNISVRVIRISEYMNEVNTFYARDRFTNETYCKFFIPRVFVKYEKVMYLDSDMVVNRDISELYAIDIGDNWWGITREKVIPVMGFVENTFEKTEFLPYIKNTLKIDSVFDYVQAGVMIWNIKKTIKDDVMSKCIAKFKELGMPLWLDQCVMSSLANGKNIFWLPQNWNVMWNAPFHWSAAKGSVAYETVMHLLANPFILHYCSNKKPWNEPWLPNAHLFWQYARKSPFYEMILTGKALPREDNWFQKINRRIKRKIRKSKKLFYDIIKLQCL